MKSDFRLLDASEKISSEQIRPGLTYWKDAWRRLKKNKLAMIGLVVIGLMTLFAIFGPLFTPYKYSDQKVGFTNLPPRIEIIKTGDKYFYFNGDYYFLFTSTKDGRLLEKLDEISTDTINRRVTYDLDGETVVIDYSYKLTPKPGFEDVKYSVTYDGVEYTETYKTLTNKLFPWGSDDLGRDVLTRVMYGARISLFIALVAALVNLIIGVLYGSIAGLEGGLVDDIMMRILDVIDSIPLLLYVILIMVILDDNSMFTVILTLGLVYWVGMARLVRGQVLGLKNQEFVLAARSLGVSKYKIVFKHLIPNALGPIIVSITMMIPAAIFTEAFLSYIGLGASAPQASWGTLANDGAKVYRTSFYQLVYPAIAIAVTILAFNFFGDGLRSALDPKLRKG
ncbi:MAG: ABC transporter permease [Acholeplasmataceae bacterium]|jgi:oligopeptide transport system permease protein|nr:ABC transporter permease [Acholeplasmataceae bacterium]